MVCRTPMVVEVVSDISPQYLLLPRWSELACRAVASR